MRCFIHYTTHYTLHTTHYTTLHYTILHYTTLYYTILHYTTVMVAGFLAQNKGRQRGGVVEAKASGCIAETAKWPNMGKHRHIA